MLFGPLFGPQPPLFLIVESAGSQTPLFSIVESGGQKCEARIA